MRYCEECGQPHKGYREWSEMKADGIEIETMQEYVDEVRGLHDYEPEPMDAYDYEMSGLAARDAYYEDLAESRGVPVEALYDREYEMDGNDDDYMDES